MVSTTLDVSDSIMPNRTKFYRKTNISLYFLKVLKKSKKIPERREGY